MKTRQSLLRTSRQATRTAAATPSIARCRKKFERIFPGAFRDENYLAWERDYKWEAHREWEAQLNRAVFSTLLQEEAFEEIAARAVKIESGRSLLFSFEKMALRDAVRPPAGAKAFATGLYEFLHGGGELRSRFMRWCETVERLPRRQTRVSTWPVVTVFGFIAQPRQHIFLKPNTIKRAALKFGFEFHYATRPNWDTYANYLAFAACAKTAVADWRPRDLIDIQSFLWVQGADEYR